MTTRYRPGMSHYYRFKRGDRVTITWGRFAGESDSAANLDYVTVRVLDVGVRGSVAAVLADV